MKYIANILTDEPFSGDSLYNVVRDRNALISNIPTLIIGWEKTKGEFPDASIIEWNVTDNVFWTYGKYERRDKYEVNVKKFQDFVFKKLIDTLEYVFYDVLLSSSEKFESFLTSLSSNTAKTIYVSGDMMYICYDGAQKVVGLSLRDCDYLKPDLRKRIFSTIYNSQSVNLLKNSNEISPEIRFKMKGRLYILPYLYS